MVKGAENSPSYTKNFDKNCLQVSLLIKRELEQRARDFNIILDDVAITDLTFGREYTAAVEKKQIGKHLMKQMMIN